VGFSKFFDPDLEAAVVPLGEPGIYTGQCED